MWFENMLMHTIQIKGNLVCLTRDDEPGLGEVRISAVEVSFPSARAYAEYLRQKILDEGFEVAPPAEDSA